MCTGKPGRERLLQGWELNGGVRDCIMLEDIGIPAQPRWRDLLSNLSSSEEA